MPGGLLNLISYGQENILLTGNPKKTFFTCSYKKHTNFGLQRFRIDYKGQKTLSFNSETDFEFTIPRYGDLLNDTYIVLNLPDIWSPIFSCMLNSKGTDISNNFIPYQFQWCKHLGAKMIKEISITSGGSILSKYSGEWLYTCIERDETGKKELWNRMIGHEPRLYDPASVNHGFYPNAQYISPTKKCEPSIKGRKLYIPLMSWFCNNPKSALPLIAIQYQEITIKVSFNPIKDLFTIMDLPPNSIFEKDISNVFINYNEKEIRGGWPNSVNNKDIRRAPKKANMYENLWVFLQPPPIGSTTYPGATPITDEYIKKNEWSVDLHLIGTYIFLSDEERECFSGSNHDYLIKQIYEHDFENITGSTRVDILARNMVSNLIFRFRRSDVYLRNEWYNYSNWAWEDKIPYEISRKNLRLTSQSTPYQASEINGFLGEFKVENNKNILLDMGILCGEQYRESILDYGVYEYVEKWNKTTGIAKDGLYMYNFCLNTSRFDYQPSGAQNVNKWKFITFEFNTLEPPRNPNFKSDINLFCNSDNIIEGVRKNIYEMNKYNYDLKIFEERYNVIKIQSGQIGLLHAR